LWSLLVAGAGQNARVRRPSPTAFFRARRRRPHPMLLISLAGKIGMWELTQTFICLTGSVTSAKLFQCLTRSLSVVSQTTHVVCSGRLRILSSPRTPAGNFRGPRSTSVQSPAKKPFREGWEHSTDFYPRHMAATADAEGRTLTAMSSRRTPSWFENIICAIVFVT